MGMAGEPREFSGAPIFGPVKADGDDEPLATEHAPDHGTTRDVPSFRLCVRGCGACRECCGGIVP
jgi:hypothetical protein